MREEYKWWREGREVKRTKRRKRDAGKEGESEDRRQEKFSPGSTHQHGLLKNIIINNESRYFKQCFSPTFKCPVLWVYTETKWANMIHFNECRQTVWGEDHWKMFYMLVLYSELTVCMVSTLLLFVFLRQKPNLKRPVWLGVVILFSFL